MSGEIGVRQSGGERAARAEVSARLSRVEVAALLLLVVVTALTSLYTAWRMFTYDAFDYRFHIETALLMKEKMSLELPHFLYHVYIILLDTLLPGLAQHQLATLSIVSLRAASASVLFFVLREAVPRPLTPRTGLVLAGVSFALLIVAPITIRTWGEGRMYLGYIGLNAFHNPTIIALVPLALPLAWVATRIAFSAPDRPGLGRDTALAALLITLSTLAKPSYLICLLPAVGLLAAWRRLCGERLPWRALILGLVVPGAILLAWQYIFTYGGLSSSDTLRDAQITFDPLRVMSIHSSGSLIDKFLFSIAYPALVYGLFFPATFRDHFLTLSAAAFAVGTGVTYLLAESGARVEDGNFIWSAQITLWIWFVAATRFLIRRNHPTIFGRGGWARVRTFATLTALGLHLFSGFVYQLRGALFVNGYTKPPEDGYYYAPPTLESTLSAPVYDAYQTYRARQMRAYIASDATGWGLLWVPEQAAPDRYALIGAVGERIEADPAMPLAHKAAYFDLIARLHRLHYFDPVALSAGQGAAFARWQTGGRAADLRAAGAASLVASEAWVQAQPGAVRDALADPEQYTRLPVKDDLSLFAASGN